MASAPGFKKSLGKLLEDILSGDAKPKEKMRADHARLEEILSGSRRPEARGMTPTRLGVPDGRKWGGLNGDEPLVGGTPEALARAKAQGFDVDTPLYHGTEADFSAFDGAAWLTGNPRRASDYAEGWLGRANGERGAAVLPVISRGRVFRFAPDRDKTSISRREMNALRDQGYDGVEMTGIGGGVDRLVYDPKNIRSRFAAFDPAKKDSSDLLASVPLGLGFGAGATALSTGDEAEAAPLIKPKGFLTGLEAPDGKLLGYHGSPYTFGKFDFTKMGSGEGAQAYGWGGYIAGAPETGIDYRNKLSAIRLSNMQRQLDLAGGDVDRALDLTNADIDRLMGLPNAGNDVRRRDGLVNLKREALEELKHYKETGNLNTGRLYEVDIPEGPYIDYDKPWGQQEPEVLERTLAAFDLDRGKLGRTGALKAPLHVGTPEAAEKLARAGIVGSRYLDQGSRAAGEGSSNYVMFNDKDINIRKMLGLGLGAGGLFAASGAGDEAEAARLPKLTGDFAALDASLAAREARRADVPYAPAADESYTPVAPRPQAKLEALSRFAEPPPVMKDGMTFSQSAQTPGHDVDLLKLLGLPAGAAGVAGGVYAGAGDRFRDEVAFDAEQSRWLNDAQNRTDQLFDDWRNPKSEWQTYNRQEDERLRQEQGRVDPFTEQFFKGLSFNNATPSEQLGAFTGPFMEAVAANYNPTNPWAGEQSPQLTGEQVQRTRDATLQGMENYPMWAQARADKPIDLIGDALELADPTWFGVSAARDWVDRRKKREALENILAGQ